MTTKKQPHPLQGLSKFTKIGIFGLKNIPSGSTGLLKSGFKIGSFRQSLCGHGDFKRK
jgi:hypothetical protein